MTSNPATQYNDLETILVKGRINKTTAPDTDAILRQRMDALWWEMSDKEQEVAEKRAARNWALLREMKDKSCVVPLVKSANNSYNPIMSGNRMPRLMGYSKFAPPLSTLCERPCYG